MPISDLEFILDTSLISADGVLRVPQPKRPEWLPPLSDGQPALEPPPAPSNRELELEGVAILGYN